MKSRKAQAIIGIAVIAAVTALTGCAGGGVALPNTGGGGYYSTTVEE